MEKLKVAIVGFGFMGRTHYGVWKKLRNAKVVCVCDSNLAQITAKTKGNLDVADNSDLPSSVRVYDDFDKMLETEKLDAVDITLPTPLHPVMSIKALENGVNVLCEKPMAVSIEECMQMVEEAEKNDRKLMIGQNQRLAKAHVKAKELLDGGIIGRVLSFKTCFGHSGPDHWSVDSGTSNWFFDKSRSAFGAMADLGVHKTDLIQYLLDSNVAEVQAVVTTLDKCYPDGHLVDVDDNCICIYKMQNGIIGTMTASWTYYGEEDNSTILYGTKGIMKLYSNREHSVEVILRKGERQCYDVDAIQTNDNQTSSGIIDAFVEAVLQDKESEISGKDVLAAMKAIFAAVKASETGVVQKIN